jgi:hypothetical protein
VTAEPGSHEGPLTCRRVVPRERERERAVGVDGDRARAPEASVRDRDGQAVTGWPVMPGHRHPGAGRPARRVESDRRRGCRERVGRGTVHSRLPRQPEAFPGLRSTPERPSTERDRPPQSRPARTRRCPARPTARAVSVVSASARDHPRQVSSATDVGSPTATSSRAPAAAPGPAAPRSVRGRPVLRREELVTGSSGTPNRSSPNDSRVSLTRPWPCKSPDSGRARGMDRHVCPDFGHETTP